MRKTLATIAAAAVALPAATILMTATPAAAGCPNGDGTIPGTGSRVIAVGPFYVDDRDFLDLDEDDNADGLWVYMETNNKPNLQRGGDQVVFATMAANGVNPNIPTIQPIVTPVVTLFPSGAGGGSLSELAGFHDECDAKAKPNDSIVF